jgi:O-antigen/teichoic acid export membrane protein
MSLSKSVIWYSIGNVVSRSVGFILLPLYSNLIEPNEFGVYALLMSAYAVIIVLFQGGLLQGFTKFFLDSNDQSEKKKIFSNTFNLLSILAFICALFLSVVSKKASLLLLGTQTYSGAIIIVAWMVFVDSISAYLINLYKTVENARRAVLITITGGIANLIFNLLFVVNFRLGIRGMLYSQLFSGILQLIYSFSAFKGNYTIIKDYSLLKKLCYFSLPFVISGFFSTLVDIADRFILDHFMDKGTVGIYSFAYKIAMVMNLFAIAFKTAWTPYSIRIYREGGYSALFGDVFSKILSAGLLLFLSVSLLIEFVFSFSFGGVRLFGPGYVQCLGIIPIVMLGYLFNSMASFFSVYPYVSGKSSHFLVSDLIAFIINMSFNLLLIPRYGMTGAALATVLSFAAVFIYLAAVSESIKIKFHTFKNILIILAAALVYYLGRTVGNIGGVLIMLGIFAIIAIKMFNINIKKIL